jgi:hypothetical protein
MISTLSLQFPRRKRLPATSPHYGLYGLWLEDALQRDETLGVSELVLSSVISLATNQPGFSRPSSADEVLTFVRQFSLLQRQIPRTAR